MAPAMEAGGEWQLARTPKQKKPDLGRDGAFTGSYVTLSMIKKRYLLQQSLYKLAGMDLL